jgi:hypothetical protein
MELENLPQFPHRAVIKRLREADSQDRARDRSRARMDQMLGRTMGRETWQEANAETLIGKPDDDSCI